MAEPLEAEAATTESVVRMDIKAVEVVVGQSEAVVPAED